MLARVTVAVLIFGTARADFMSEACPQRFTPKVKAVNCPPSDPKCLSHMRASEENQREIDKIAMCQAIRDLRNAVSALSGGASPSPAPHVDAIAPVTGAVGTTLLLSGSDFVGAFSCKIGGVEASARSVLGASSMTCTVANGTTGGEIVVTSAAGASTGGPTFTVVDPGTCSIASVTGQDTSAQAGGSPVQLSFTATASPAACEDTSVICSVASGYTGGTYGSVSSSCLFTPPASVPSGGISKVTGCAAADATKCATVTIGMSPFSSVYVNDATLAESQSATVSATVTAPAGSFDYLDWTADDDTGSTWQHNSQGARPTCSGGGTACGTLSQAACSGTTCTVLYTAPACGSPPCSFRLRATSHLDPVNVGDFDIVTVTGTGSPLAITPTSGSVTPGGTVPFTASGGTAPYTWSVQTNNSGGNMTPGTGYFSTYTAGSISSVTDTVRVTDSAGSPAHSDATITVNPPLALGAFPGCEGAGCSTRAGWNSTPTLYFVTTTADSGAGSLRACVEASGPRVCLFRVAGEISTSGLAVNNPYLSLRCDTAPGDGVQINQHNKTACGGNGGYTFVVQTHDVLIRGCRIREGANIAAGSDCRAFAFEPGAVHGDIHHVVIDHSSFSWGHDQVADIGAWSYSNSSTLPRHSQYGWSLIYEGLDKGGNNSRGSLMDDGEDLGHDQYMSDLDLHHNFWANNVQRNPLVRAASARMINNLVYNWSESAINPWGYSGNAYGTFSIDLVGNVAKAGPMTPGSGTSHGLIMLTYDNQSVYLSGNHYAGGSEQGWGSVGITYEVGSGQTHRTNALSPASSGPAITVTTDETALVSSITGSMGAGASRRLDCGGNWVDNRDSADARVLGYWASPSSGPSAAVASVPAWPSVTAIASTTVCASNARDNAACVCADTDSDGIPDYFEHAWAGSDTGMSAGGTTILNPYTNLEAYLSGQAGKTSY